MNKIKQAIYKAMTGYCPSKREFILLGCAFAAALPFILIKKGMEWLWSEWIRYVCRYSQAIAFTPLKAGR